MKDSPTQKWIVWMLVVIMTGAIGCMDWLTGHRLSFFAFYFIPVGMTAWYLGWGNALVAAVICTGVWFYSDAFFGAVREPLYSFWNALMRLVSFLAIGWSLQRVHRSLVQEQETARELYRSMAEVKILEGLLPVCAQCKKIRDETGNWQPMEKYFTAHSEAQFTHGYCPDCANAILADAGIKRQLDRN